MHVTEFPDFLYENGLVAASFSYRTLVFFAERMRTDLSFLFDNNFFKFQVSCSISIQFKIFILHRLKYTMSVKKQQPKKSMLLRRFIKSDKISTKNPCF